MAPSPSCIAYPRAGSRGRRGWRVRHHVSIISILMPEVSNRRLVRTLGSRGRRQWLHDVGRALPWKLVDHHEAKAWPDVVRHSQLHLNSTPTTPTTRPGQPQMASHPSRLVSAILECLVSAHGVFRPDSARFLVSNRRTRWSQAHRVSSAGTLWREARLFGFIGRPPRNESGLDSAHRGTSGFGNPEMDALVPDQEAIADRPHEQLDQATQAAEFRAL
ncbi:hypothetical protein G7Z17_g4247 [Cylindrodendrum hubeiense]|uniref:Uncharacterized protein n=1 Tax=Cylindrodendrum hubeiense TaxID=595255 RepID=A0A9P5LII8_9HYPO|nr:hypothetical protein G7Z17_g4247 [Cylindrodendrum hubeiense]